MRKVVILYRNFYTPDGKEMSIGGIQTYIKMLIDVIKKNNMTPVIYQYSSVEFHKQYQDVDVYGVSMQDGWKEKKRKQVLFNRGQESLDSNSDILLFACETLAVKNTDKRVIGIQHGISWDVKSHENFTPTQNLMYVFLKAFRAMKLIKRIRNVNHLVAVDYNFLNWYRTQVAYTEVDVNVIPNCIEVGDFIKSDNEKINIIFARRFISKRGTRVFAEAMKDILQRYENVCVTFAGEGPDEKYLKNEFKNNSTVKFIKYKSDESMEIHKQYDIAVIPTIGSEGTSFSLLEAMAAKCAVVSSNVGGMTNILLDNYNGLMINPNQKDLKESIELLINDKDLREKLSANAYTTVLESFNRSLWEKRWTEVFNSVLD